MTTRLPPKTHGPMVQGCPHLSCQALTVRLVWSDAALKAYSCVALREFGVD